MDKGRTSFFRLFNSPKWMQPVSFIPLDHRASQRIEADFGEIWVDFRKRQAGREAALLRKRH